MACATHIQVRNAPLPSPTLLERVCAASRLLKLAFFPMHHILRDCSRRARAKSDHGTLLTCARFRSGVDISGLRAVERFASRGATTAGTQGTAQVGVPTHEKEWWTTSRNQKHRSLVNASEALLYVEACAVCCSGFEFRAKVERGWLHKTHLLLRTAPC